VDEPGITIPGGTIDDAEMTVGVGDDALAASALAGKDMPISATALAR
jgi:fructose-specific component phosphotransferase system IIB-like protein